MHLHLSTPDLHLKLATLARAADAKSSMPALACVRIDARLDGSADLTATDTRLTATTTLPATIGRAGAILIPAKALADVVRGARSTAPTVEIQAIGESDPKSGEIRVSVRPAGGAAITLTGRRAEDFPVVPALGTVGEVVDARLFARALRVVLPSVSTDETRYHLNGVHLDARGGHLLAVSTDGHRLARTSFPALLPALAAVGALLIPDRAASEIVRLVGKGTGTLRIGVADRIFVAHYMGVTLAAKLIDAVFPPYEQVIPRPPLAQRATCDRIAFARAIRDTLAAMERNERPGVVLGFAAGVGRVTRETDRTHAVADFPVDFEDDAPDVIDAVAVNGSYLLDALDGIMADRVTLSFADALGPIRLDGDSRTVHVIMPMREDLQPRHLPTAAAA